MTTLTASATPTTVGGLERYLANLDDETAIIEILGNLEVLAREPGEAGAVAAMAHVVTVELLRRFAAAELRRAIVVHACRAVKMAWQQGVSPGP